MRRISFTIIIISFLISPLAALAQENSYDDVNAVKKGHDQIVSQIDYEANNQIKNLTFANGVITANTYDPAKLLRLTNKKTVKNQTVLQDIGYTYDPVGNLTDLVDQSATKAAKTAHYDYDDLYRLTGVKLASEATSTPADNQTYQYDILGNILFKSDIGDYSYTGHQATSYANPHAATAIAASTYDYDKNGNLTKANNWQYTYDYNNRLIKANQGAINLNYGYDHQGERLFYSTASSTTIYANKYLNYQTGPKKITKQVYSGDLLLATVETENSQDKIYYAHTDHLTGANVITDKNGNLAQTLDYYPFGEVRLDERTGTFNQQKKFTGKELDQETGLYYFGARYQNPALGRFASLDPVFNAMGDEAIIKSKTGMKPQKLLENPQALNSYSYAINNPLVIYDPSGEWIEYFIGDRNAVSLGNWANGLYSNSSVARYTMDHPFQAGAAAGAIGGAIIGGGVLVTGGNITCGILCGGSVAKIGTIGSTAASTQGSKVKQAAESGTKLLNGPINITTDRLGHILNNHSLGGANTTGKSIFNAGENIVDLIKSGTQQPLIKQSFGNNFQRVFNVGRNIGIDRATNQQTSTMTIITNKAGRMITAFPGLPGEP